jgi:hypothetical protein
MWTERTLFIPVLSPNGAVATSTFERVTVLCKGMYNAEALV